MKFRFVTFFSLFIVTLLMSENVHGGKPHFKEFDFAYPRTVAEESMAALEKTRGRTEAGPDRLYYLQAYAAAVADIDADSTFAIPAMTARYAGGEGLSAADRAMLLTLEAWQYAGIYAGNRWKYNSIDAPALPLPDDVSLWSAAQFYGRVSSLLQQAASLADGSDAPLRRYSGAINVDDSDLVYFPSVSDFIAVTALDIYGSFRYGTVAEASAAAAKALVGQMAATAPGTAPWYYWQMRLNENDTDALMALYDRHSADEHARLFLAAAAGNTYTPGLSVTPTDSELSDRRAADNICAAVESSLRQFPAWHGNDALRLSARRLHAPAIAFRTPSMCAPGDSIRVEYASAFLASARLMLHALPADDTPAFSPGDYPPIYSCTLPGGDKGVVRSAVSFAVPRAGRYAVTVEGADDTETATLLCTPFIPVTMRGMSRYPLIAADYATGAPVPGVAVERTDYTGRRNAAQPHYEGITGRDGIFIGKSTDKSGRMAMKYKGVRYTFSDALRIDALAPAPSERTQAFIVTDRALFHPGDTVQWMFAAARGSGDNVAMLGGKKVEVSFYDANSQIVDTLSVVTDAYGRCHGSFCIPKGMLTGQWSISGCIDKRDTAWSSITVSDFRLPTFEVEIKSVERDTPSPGSVTLGGVARTYAGMAVTGADVAADVKIIRWWRYTSGNTVARLSAVTDADGTFTVVVPADSLVSDVDADGIQGLFCARITVTAPGAETAQTYAFFNTGKPYGLRVADAPAYADTDTPLSFTVKAFGADGNNAAIAFRWQMIDAQGQKVCGGEATAGERLSVPVSGLAAGTYAVSLSPVDSAMADAVDKAFEVTLYNERLNLLPPSAGRLFVPVTEYELSGGRAGILVGTCSDVAYVYVAEQQGKELQGVTLHKIRCGFTRLTVRGDADKSVALFTVGGGTLSHATVNLSVPAPAPDKVVATSFRDRLVPGNTEMWTLRLVDGKDKALPKSAMVATLYNKALDALERYHMPWGFSFGSTSATRTWLTFRDLSYSDLLCREYFARTAFDIAAPSFLYSMQPAGPVQYLGSVKIRGGGAAVTNGMVAESEYEEKVPAYAGVAAETVDDAADSSEDISADNPADISGGPDAHYRPSDVLQGFWKPTLVSDAEGNVNLVFTVPDANGTWQLEALAWTPGGKMLRYANTAVSNKPVMVQPNAPRFLRQGDRCTILATVYNNTGSTAAVDADVEIFSLADGSVMQRRQYKFAIPAGGSDIAAIDLVAPAGSSAIGYRAKARSGSFADGEQTAIPILESASTVVESELFYLPPTSADPFELSINTGSDATVTLQYTQNPLWNVVRAMRGIRANTAGTSTALASRLFSAYAGRHIVTEYPSVGTVLQQWQQDDGKALTSMLERNDDLKRLLLCQTPWVQAATDNDSRMAMLADLFDADAVAAATADATRKLLALQNSDGGFAWASWCAGSSVWCTEAVLATMALANSLGMLPSDDDNLTEALDDAFVYLQRDALEPRRPDTSVSLALISALMPSLTVTDKARAVIDRTVTDMERNWKNHGITDKAYDILILKAHGRDAVAAQILGSLRQYALTDAAKGTSFPNVRDIRAYATIIQAYAAMDAPAGEIDAIRQYVLLRTQATDNLGAMNPDYVIAAIMFGGSLWTDVPAGDCVTVNGAAADVPAEAGSGYVSMPLPVGGGKVTVTVRPNGVTPSFGSVTSVSRKSLDAIAAHAGEDIDIAKRVLVYRRGEWVETDSFVLGERVRVQLTLSVCRDMQYVTVDDERPAAFEPVEQLPGYVWDASVGFYRENLDASTRLFIDWLPRGSYVITYDMTINLAGDFMSGIATVQSQYAPELTAHSAAAKITCKSKTEL